MDESSAASLAMTAECGRTDRAAGPARQRSASVERRRAGHRQAASRSDEPQPSEVVADDVPSDEPQPRARRTGRTAAAEAIDAAIKGVEAGKGGR